MSIPNTGVHELPEEDNIGVFFFPFPCWKTMQTLDLDIAGQDSPEIKRKQK